MIENSPLSVGLGGDGDEIAAFHDVEREFGVQMDYAEASQWLTAGDVFASLQTVLPAEARDGSDLWQRFAAALCRQTGVNPADIERGSPLLSESRFWAHMADVSAVLWIIATTGFLVLLAAALV